MNVAFYSGASGMSAFQKQMDITANNIANVSTTGFKPQRGAFSELLYSRLAVNNEQEFLTGHGVRVERADLLFRQGMINNTGNPLDFAIIGDGFFAVEKAGDDTGESITAYTRRGEFAIGLEDGSTGYLVTADGDFVLSVDGERIEVPRLENDENTFDLSAIQDLLGIYNIPNPYGLLPAGDSLYVATAKSGEAQIMEEGDEGGPSFRVVQNALERSAVELADEMVMVIQNQRAFQMSARLVQTADQLEEIVNNLR